jgi:hypothetical protein
MTARVATVPTAVKTTRAAQVRMAETWTEEEKGVDSCHPHCPSRKPKASTTGWVRFAGASGGGDENVGADALSGGSGDVCTSDIIVALAASMVVIVESLSVWRGRSCSWLWKMAENDEVIHHCCCC